ncbi:MAG: class I SAM-dependent methyltransferase [Candidatus Methanofastidiosia archaeon]|jgi:2-polyprenyl-6-hydroxyphenyl methylase/3-demethylubiquinone-9 3-methyltransferase
MPDYYAHNLFGKNLKKCYDIAPPRVAQYLQAEIDYVIEQVTGSNRVLELGCGYGRVLAKVSPCVNELIGIDTSVKTLQFAKEYLEVPNCVCIAMDASQLGLDSNTFDAVFCIQNGISAFKVDSKKVVKEAIRVTRKGGVILFSTYSPHFWENRLHWFKLQSASGLIGEIDESKTRNGKIVCKDGFRATYITGDQFTKLFDTDKTQVSITEVDESSVFCVVTVL